MKLSSCLFGAVVLASSTAFSQPLKVGTFQCEDSNYNEHYIAIEPYPEKPHKIRLILNNRARILHNEPTTSGALRYDGAISKLTYIQTPSHSVLLDSNEMKVVLSNCRYIGK